MDGDTSLAAVVGVAIWLMSMGLAVAIGVWLMRRVRIAPPQGLRGGVLAAAAFNVWVWLIRLFVFLVVVVTVLAAVSIVVTALIV